jgi:hypothetical protein
MLLLIMGAVLAGVALQRVPCYPPDLEMSSPPELYVTSVARNKYGGMVVRSDHNEGVWLTCDYHKDDPIEF